MPAQYKTALPSFQPQISSFRSLQLPRSGPPPPNLKFQISNLRSFLNESPPPLLPISNLKFQISDLRSSLNAPLPPQNLKFQISNLKFSPPPLPISNLKSVASHSGRPSYKS